MLLVAANLGIIDVDHHHQSTNWEIIQKFAGVGSSQTLGCLKLEMFYDNVLQGMDHTNFLGRSTKYKNKLY